mmetsp:Transcript_41344/g.62987  ORF Transcript_41344/g.62987 Transcript_41344/m.62987 type:complete len:95 (-) Transcript_41344:507-791(-)
MTSYSLIEYGLSIIEKLIQNSWTEVHEREKLREEEETLQQQLTRKRKLTHYEHKGYAFDGAAGQDQLITDRLFDRFSNAIQTQIFDNPPLFFPV